MINWTNKIVSALENIIAVIVMLGISVTVFLQVITRYAFHTPLSWTEELARILLIWATFVGASLAMRAKGHFVLEWVIDKLPSKIRSPFEVILLVLMGVFLCVLFFTGIEVLPVVHMQTSPSLGIPMTYVYLSIPVGAALMLARLCLLLFEKLMSLFRFRREGY